MTPGSWDVELRSRIDSYLYDCYAAGSPPRVDEFARHIGLHPVILRRRAKLALGMTLSRHLKLLQVQFACNLLLVVDFTMEEVSRRAAFGSRRSFLRAFRREVQQTPQAYRSAKLSLDR